MQYIMYTFFWKGFSKWQVRNRNSTASSPKPTVAMDHGWSTNTGATSTLVRLNHQKMVPSELRSTTKFPMFKPGSPSSKKWRKPSSRKVSRSWNLSFSTTTFLWLWRRRKQAKPNKELLNWGSLFGLFIIVKLDC